MPLKTKKTITVGFVQNAPEILKVEANVREALALIGNRKSDVWVFPEFFATGYKFESKKEVAQVAEIPPHGKTCQALIEFAGKRKCAVIAGFVEKSGHSFFNSALIVHDGKFSVYRKTHLFSEEKKFFSPGNTGFKVNQMSGIKAGVMICFDWIFPESARSLALQGAEIIFHPSNLVLPWGPEAMKIRSLENRVFSVTANRIGSERGLTFIGQSQIVRPNGQVLVRAPRNKSCAETVALDLVEARNKNVTRLNHLFHDRRPEHYRTLTARG